MLIDDAAAAFLAAGQDYTIERSLVNAKGWVVKDAEGNRLCSGMGHSHDECVKMVEDQTLKDRITAAVSEMISVRVLTVALMNCGAPPQGALSLAQNLLPAIIKLASTEGDEVLVGKPN